MARSRNIKPSFFINDELAEIDPLGRLLFIGLWTIADREGRLEYRPARIKIETLPYDNCDIEKLLEDLETRSFILTYFHEGSRYIQITNFCKHQNPHRNEKESEIPAPDVIEKLPEHSDTTPEITGTVQEMHSTNRADSLNMIPDSGFPTTDSLNGTEVVGSSLDQIQKLYFDTMGTVITKHNLETIMTYLKDGLTEWHICRALQLTSENSKRSFKYTMGILNNWVQQKAFSPEDVKLLELEHQRRGSPNQPNRSGETAAERLLREAIEREQAEADIIDVAWAEGG